MIWAQQLIQRASLPHPVLCVKKTRGEVKKWCDHFSCVIRQWNAIPFCREREATPSSELESMASRFQSQPPLSRLNVALFLPPSLPPCWKQILHRTDSTRNTKKPGGSVLCPPLLLSPSPYWEGERDVKHIVAGQMWQCCRSLLTHHTCHLGAARVACLGCHGGVTQTPFYTGQSSPGPYHSTLTTGPLGSTTSKYLQMT